MRDYEDEIERAGATLAAIGLGDELYGQAFKQETGIGFPLLIDDDRQAYDVAGLKVANILHLVRRDNIAGRKRASAGGHSQHKTGKNPFQLGGSFVFGPGNVDIYAHLSETFEDNADPSELVSALG